MDGLILVQVLLLLQSHLLTQGRSTHGHFVPTMASDLFASRRNAPGQHLANHVTRSERASRVANNKFESQVTHELKRNANANFPFLKGFFDHDSMRNGQHFLAELIYGSHRSQGHGGDLIDQHKQRNDRLQGVVGKTPVQLARASFRRPSGRIWNAGKYDHHAFSDNLSPTELTHDGEHDLDAISDNLSPIELTHDGTHDLHASDNLSPTELTHDLDAFSDNLSPIELTHDGTHDLHASDNLSPTELTHDFDAFSDNLSPTELTHDGTHDLDAFSDNLSPIELTHDGTHDLHASDNLSPTNAKQDAIGWKSQLASSKKDSEVFSDPGTPLTGEDSDTAQTDSSHTNGEHFMAHSDQVAQVDLVSDVKEESSLQASLQEGLPDAFEREESTQLDDNVKEDLPDAFKREESTQFGDNVNKEIDQNLIDQNILLSSSSEQALQGNILPGQNVKELYNMEEAHDHKYTEFSSPDDATSQQNSLSPASVVTNTFADNQVKLASSVVSSGSEELHEVLADEQLFGSFKEATGSSLTSSEDVKSEVSESDAVKSEVSESDAVKSEVSESDAVKSEVSESDAVKSEVSESDAVKSEVSESDAVKSEVSESDAVKSEVSKSDAVKSGLSRRDVMTNAHVQADLKGRRL